MSDAEQESAPTREELIVVLKTARDLAEQSHQITTLDRLREFFRSLRHPNGIDPLPPVYQEALKAIHAAKTMHSYGSRYREVYMSSPESPKCPSCILELSIVPLLIDTALDLAEMAGIEKYGDVQRRHMIRAKVYLNVALGRIQNSMNHRGSDSHVTPTFQSEFSKVPKHLLPISHR